MLKNRYALLALAAALSLASCKKDDDSPTTTPPAGNGKLYFSGLTITDPYGTYQNIDVTDWRTDDANWTEAERALFGLNDGPAEPNPDPVFPYDIKPYPNPCDTVCRVQFNKPTTAHISYRVVDDQFRVLLSKDSVTDHIVKLDSAFLSTIRDTVRMYYKITEPGNNNRMLYGHGDILVRD